MFSSTPPKYSEIGKQVKDLFNKNYNFGNIKFELKTTSPAGSVLGIEGISEIESGKLGGFVQFKNVLTNDITIANKWLSDNTIASEVVFENRLQSGTKFGILTNFDPKSGKLGGSLNAEFKSSSFISSVDCAMRDGHPIFMPSCVINFNGWLCGTQALFDPNSKGIDKPTFALGFQTGTFSAFTTLSENKEVFGTLYQKVNSEIETGITIQFPFGGNSQTKLEYAMAYSLDGSHRLQAKVNTGSQIGLALVKNFGNGIVINVSGNVDGKNIKDGAHKFGMGIQMDA